MVYVQSAPASWIFYPLSIQRKERNRRCVSNDQALSDIPRVPAPICLVWNTSIFHIGLRPDINISSYPVIIIFRFYVSFAAKQSGACSWNLIIISVQLQTHLRPAPSALENQLLLYLSLWTTDQHFSKTKLAKPVKLWRSSTFDLLLYIWSEFLSNLSDIYIRLGC